MSDIYEGGWWRGSVLTVQLPYETKKLYNVLHNVNINKCQSSGAGGTHSLLSEANYVYEIAPSPGKFR